MQGCINMGDFAAWSFAYWQGDEYG